jgi:hypothetical protein
MLIPAPSPFRSHQFLLAELGGGPLCRPDQRRLKRGSFASLDDLIRAIIGYLDHRNLDPKPFVWTASVESILAKLPDCKVVIETIH